MFLLHAEGIEHIRQRQGPLIVACNHNNAYESILVPAFLVYHSAGRKISFVIDWMFGKVPLLGHLLNAMEPVYVYHKRSTSKFLESRRPKRKPSGDTVSICCEKLRAGKRIGIFPEGTRNRNPLMLQRARPGIGHIALRSGVPVLPVGIQCVGGRKRKKNHVFGKIILKIGEPICFDDLSEVYRLGDRPSAISLSGVRERHALAQTAADRIMSCIAGLCGKAFTGNLTDQNRQNHMGDFLKSDNQY
ncbi:MAG: 1-acyl-sn-glycerol-3-phosphate acyltransferase [Chlorobium sp.]|nr:1-acyl-sn-glycerol-3-phosphate acyltransferase [Chlorobium sp.]